jgi:hypothetical protein
VFARSFLRRTATTATGGNTLCATVIGDAGDLLAVDAGTGITVWGRTLLVGDFGRGRVTWIFHHASAYDHIRVSFFHPCIYSR